LKLEEEFNSKQAAEKEKGDQKMNELLAKQKEIEE